MKDLAKKIEFVSTAGEKAAREGNVHLMVKLNKTGRKLRKLRKKEAAKRPRP